MTGYNILSSGDAENDYPLFFPETNLDLINSRSIPPEYSYTRNSSGTYVGSDGLIKTAAVNEPRFDHNPATGESLGLLVEEARTNLLTYSEQINSSNWGIITGTLSLDSSLSPSGTQPYLFTSSHSSGNGGYVYKSVGAISGNHTLSVFVKKNGAQKYAWIDLYAGADYAAVFDLDTGTYVGNSGLNSYDSYSITAVGNGWFRIAGAKNLPAGSYSVGISVTRNPTGGSIAINISGDSILIWGAQVEAGSFPTSYIPTTTSTVTRQPDQLVLNRTLNPQGAFYIEPNTTGTSLVADNGSSTISPPQGTKSALFYNTSRTLFMSSSSIQPLEGNYDVPQNLNRVSLGFDRLGNTGYINGHLKKFMYYSSPVTEDNLRSLTGNTRSTFRFDIEQIITDGLVLLLDAANPVSYPGSGTTWTDLSGNGNNGTLTNGPTYTSANDGSLVFDGVDDYVLTSTINHNIGTGNFTYSAWVYPTGLKGAGATLCAFMGNGNYAPTFGFDLNGYPSQLGFFWSGWNGFGTTLSLNQWYCVTMTRVGTLITGYLNANACPVTYNVGFSMDNDRYVIGRSGVDYAPDTFKGNISQVSIYNRALTATEIQQNFNTTRSRFGI
jgi:hypothetical protein